MVDDMEIGFLTAFIFLAFILLIIGFCLAYGWQNFHDWKSFVAYVIGIYILVRLITSVIVVRKMVENGEL